MKNILKKINTTNKLWILVPLLVLIVAMTGCSTSVPSQWVQALGNDYDTTTDCTPEGEPVVSPGWHAQLLVNQETVNTGTGFFPASNFNGFFTVYCDGFALLPYTGKVINPTNLELTIDVTAFNTTYKGKIYLRAESELKYLVPFFWVSCYMVQSTSLNPDVESWIAKYVDGVCKKKMIFTGWTGLPAAYSAAQLQQDLEDQGIEVPPDFDFDFSQGLTTDSIQ